MMLPWSLSLHRMMISQTTQRRSLLSLLYLSLAHFHSLSNLFSQVTYFFLKQQKFHQIFFYGIINYSAATNSLDKDRPWLIWRHDMMFAPPQPSHMILVRLHFAEEEIRSWQLAQTFIDQTNMLTELQNMELTALLFCQSEMELCYHMLLYQLRCVSEVHPMTIHYPDQ